MKTEPTLTGFAEGATAMEIAAVLDDAGILAFMLAMPRARADAIIGEFGSLGEAIAAPVSRLIAAASGARLRPA